MKDDGTQETKITDRQRVCGFLKGAEENSGFLTTTNTRSNHGVLFRVTSTKEQPETDWISKYKSKNPSPSLTVKLEWQLK